VAKVLADAPARAKVEGILESAADRVACMLLEHRNSLMAIADALCENDELTGEQITRIVTAVLPA
jgi:ATP-dependent Zn protease